jgi:hypothetical protein
MGAGNLGHALVHAGCQIRDLLPGRHVPGEVGTEFVVHRRQFLPDTTLQISGHRADSGDRFIEPPQFGEITYGRLGGERPQSAQQTLGPRRRGKDRGPG